MSWKRISLLLCVFGFFKEYRPSEPFNFEYLTGPWKNFTEEQVYQEVIPVATYSHLAMLLPVLLLTDFFRYKPVVVLCGFSLCCSQMVLVLAQSMWAMQIVKMFSGLAFALEVAYFSYIYAKVDKQHYQEVTSHTMMALLLGKFVASVMAQLLVSFGLLDYEQINYLTLLGVVPATIWAFFLPSVDQSIYFHTKTVCNDSEILPAPQVESEMIKLKRSTDQLYYFQLAVDSKNQDKRTPILSMRIKNAFHVLGSNFLLAYSQGHVLIWSAWSVLSACGWMQVAYYIQALWQTSSEADNVYNGAMDACQTILSALAIFGIGKLRMNWSLIGEAVIVVVALIQGTLLLVAAESYNIWFAYATYIGFAVIHQAAITVTTSEIAKYVPENSYELTYGFNLFLALALQTVITLVVTSSSGFALAIRPQFVVYGSYFIVIGGVYVPLAIYTIVKQCRSKKQLHLWG